jgi:hypothetical protein
MQSAGAGRSISDTVDGKRRTEETGSRAEDRNRNTEYQPESSIQQRKKKTALAKRPPFIILKTASVFILMEKKVILGRVVRPDVFNAFIRLAFVFDFL